MSKAELEKKHLSELHALAAEAGVEKYRMLSRGELVERLAGGASGSSSEANGDAPAGRGEGRGEGGDRPPRRRRRRRPASERDDGGADEDPSERAAEGETPRKSRQRSKPPAEATPAAPPVAAAPDADSSDASRPRRRRRRRFGRRGKQGVTLQGLLLPPEAGRQAVLYAETREACTSLLRSVAADIAADSKGPDPVALLIDPTPEELADWRREAPQAEIVAAGQPRHASDALAQAAARAGSGEDVFLLVDSLTRLGEAYGDADAAKEFFDAGRTQGAKGGGTLTVVAAVERPSDS